MRIIIITTLLFATAAMAQTSGLKIAFNVLEDQKADDYEVYTVGTDGSGMTNVTKHKDVA